MTRFCRQTKALNHKPGNQGKREGFLRAINRTLGAISRILR
jgi:hypothetical protein